MAFGRNFGWYLELYKPLWSTDSLLSGSKNRVPLAEAFFSAPVSNGVVEINDSSVSVALELRGRCMDI